jgi:hypothetical protein
MLVISLLVQVITIIETQRSMQVRRPVYKEIKKKNIHVSMSCYQSAEQKNINVDNKSQNIVFKF